MDKTLCPLCGNENACGMAAADSASRCWCEDVRVGADLLARVPDAAKRKVCICRACATAALQGEAGAKRA
jgi:hypothetical protein